MHKTMQILDGTATFPRDRVAAVTVGSFDGVHRGHQALLRALREEADRLGGVAVVVTFDPHPRVALGGGEGLHLLTDTEEKAALLAAYGVDYLVVMHFDEAFSRMSGATFVSSILMEQIGAKSLIVGYNHRFGHDRITANELYIEGLKIVCVKRCEVEGCKVSSSEIRRLLAEGNNTAAENLLGHTINRLKQ